MKTLAFIARRDGLLRDEFRAHYESVHSPMALPLLEGLERYLRHHVRRELSGEPFFDCMTSFWWRDGTAFEALFGRLEAPEGAHLRADEESFMHKAANRFFPVHERVLRRSNPRARTGLLILSKRPDDMSADEFLAVYERLLVTRLKSPDAPSGCVQNRGLNYAGKPPVYDCVTSVAFGGPDPESLSSEAAENWAEEFARPLEMGGAQLLVLGVSEHESEIG